MREKRVPQLAARLMRDRLPIMRKTHPVKRVPIVVGTILPRAYARFNAGQGPRFGSGGGGGGAVILAYGSGGYSISSINVNGRQGNRGGCYPSGNGGRGLLLRYFYGATAPLRR
uniref:Uncharacterized protein n=1 Tax=mine drainage metagenome TaxID=410659 RepID=E6Q0R3_9ZZZZ